VTDEDNNVTLNSLLGNNINKIQIALNDSINNFNNSKTGSNVSDLDAKFERKEFCFNLLKNNDKIRLKLKDSGILVSLDGGKTYDSINTVFSEGGITEK
jgi:hypothetical protein